MTTRIDILADDTVVAVWVGNRRRSSLYQSMAESNCKNVNELDRTEIAAVIMCIKQAPFPLGNGPRIYRGILEELRANGLDAYVKPGWKDLSLGQLRRAIVVRAGSGCNAPTDSYLSIAAKEKEREVQAA